MFFDVSIRPEVEKRHMTVKYLIKLNILCHVRFGVGPFRSIFHAFRSYSENLISCWTQKMFSWNLFGLLNDK